MGIDLASDWSIELVVYSCVSLVASLIRELAKCGVLSCNYRFPERQKDCG
jgi:hypothetical protein